MIDKSFDKFVFFFFNYEIPASTLWTTNFFRCSRYMNTRKIAKMARHNTNIITIIHPIPRGVVSVSKKVNDWNLENSYFNFQTKNHALHILWFHSLPLHTSFNDGSRSKSSILLFQNSNVEFLQSVGQRSEHPNLMSPLPAALGSPSIPL